MNKHQLACEAVLHWDEEAIEAKCRQGHRTDLGYTKDGYGGTAARLSKRFGVAKGYIEDARRLLRDDPEKFNLILSGEERLPRVRSKKEQGAESYALYRAYDSEGTLIYVGKTWNIGQRMRAHTGESKWWDEFTTLTVERGFNNYEELGKAECLAIRNERPTYNLKASWYESWG